MVYMSVTKRWAVVYDSTYGDKTVMQTYTTYHDLPDAQAQVEDLKMYYGSTFVNPRVVDRKMPPLPTTQRPPDELIRVASEVVMGNKKHLCPSANGSGVMCKEGAMLFKKLILAYSKHGPNSVQYKKVRGEIQEHFQAEDALLTLSS
jgi:hypothetical protein